MLALLLRTALAFPSLQRQRACLLSAVCVLASVLMLFPPYCILLPAFFLSLLSPAPFCWLLLTLTIYPVRNRIGYSWSSLETCSLRGRGREREGEKEHYTTTTSTTSVVVVVVDVVVVVAIIIGDVVVVVAIVIVVASREEEEAGVQEEGKKRWNGS